MTELHLTKAYVQTYTRTVCTQHMNTVLTHEHFTYTVLHRISVALKPQIFLLASKTYVSVIY